MKKNLLTFLFVAAFLCCGTLVASAKTTSSSGNSVAVSEAARIISRNIEALAAKCQVGFDCEAQLAALIAANNAYLAACPNMESGCGVDEANALIAAGDAYNACVGYVPEGGGVSKIIDKMKDRNKNQEANV